MTQELCTLLNLSIQAGIGRRLALATVSGDTTDPNTFYIASSRVGEAQSLADVLSVRARMVHSNQFKFKAQRIVICP